MSQPWSRTVAISLLLAGCSSNMGASPGQAPAADQAAQVAPSPLLPKQASQPFISLAGQSHGQLDEIKSGSAEKVIITQQADLDAFYARHGVKKPPTETPGALPPGVPVFTTLGNIDFGRYDVVAIVTSPMPTGSYFNIVSVDEQRVVHTTMWNPNTVTPLGDPGYYIAALPKSDKPITFADTKVIQLKIGDPVLGFARITAVPNPEITEPTLQAALKAQFPGATTVDAQLLTLQSAHDQFGVTTMPLDLDPASLVWFVRIQGTLSPDGLVATSKLTQSGAQPAITSIQEVLSVEDLSPIEVDG